MNFTYFYLGGVNYPADDTVECGCTCKLKVCTSIRCKSTQQPFFWLWKQICCCFCDFFLFRSVKFGVSSCFFSSFLRMFIAVESPSFVVYVLYVCVFFFLVFWRVFVFWICFDEVRFRILFRWIKEALDFYSSKVYQLKTPQKQTFAFLHISHRQEQETTKKNQHKNDEIQKQNKKYTLKLTDNNNNEISS